ncbi:hypothetical protein Mapa_009532 [Marchantia paleacea]|nr:hypothetical protein Mapa_009532 [Marchantia paleacea]
MEGGGAQIRPVQAPVPSGPVQFNPIQFSSSSRAAQASDDSDLMPDLLKDERDLYAARSRSKLRIDGPDRSY